MTARALALAALTAWRAKEEFADAILQRLLAASGLGASDRAFATELFYGILRNLTLLDFWIGLLRPASVDDKSRDLLRLGLYQLLILRTPGHAAVFETVTLATKHRRSLINGVLRNAQRRSAELETAAHTAPLAIQKSHPEFLLERWQRQFGQDATEMLCEWNNTPAPVYARVNQLKITPEQFVSDHPSSETLPGVRDFIRLAHVPLDAVARGDCYIQDPSTRLACHLLAPQPGEDVLDACAAPGGKTGLLAALMQNSGCLVACDRDPSRVETLRMNLNRLGATMARTVCHDWRSSAPFAGDDPLFFDRILVDAPCTNTGVMRRRVDLRWRLQPTDFERLQRLQLAILRAVLPLLKPGGTLVYSTCSLEDDENGQVVRQSLQEFPFLEQTEEQSTTPFRDSFDGAFAARFLRTS